MTLGNMPPGSAVDNVRNSRRADMVLCREIDKGCVPPGMKAANLYHFLFRESGQAVTLTRCQTYLQRRSSFAFLLIYLIAVPTNIAHCARVTGGTVANKTATSLALIRPYHVAFGQLVAFGAMGLALPVARVVFPCLKVAAALLHHVRIVIGMCPKFEVRNSNTSRRVANMQKNHAVRDGAIFQFPRKTMRKVAFSADDKMAVIVRVRGRGPQPAIARLIHFIPKALFSGRAKMPSPRTHTRQGMFYSDRWIEIGEHVAYILGLSSKYQVVWVAAWSKMAGVPNNHAIGNDSFVDLVGDAVSEMDFAFDVKASMSCGIKSRTQPLPTIMRAEHLNFFPKVLECIGGVLCGMLCHVVSPSRLSAKAGGVISAARLLLRGATALL